MPKNYKDQSIDIKGPIDWHSFKKLIFKEKKLDRSIDGYSQSILWSFEKCCFWKTNIGQLIDGLKQSIVWSFGQKNLRKTGWTNRLKVWSNRLTYMYIYKLIKTTTNVNQIIATKSHKHLFIIYCIIYLRLSQQGRNIISQMDYWKSWENYIWWEN